MKNRVPLREQKPFAHLQQKQDIKEEKGPANFVVPVQTTNKRKSNLLNNKAFVAAIKKAWQTGNLALVHYDLQDFPDEIINIDTINLEGEEWWQKCPLTKLDLTNNNIQDIPLYDTLQELQVLRLGNNKIGRFHFDLTKQFQNLKSLTLQNNQLVEFSCRLDSIVELNLADNKLTGIDNLYFPNLEILDITNNQFAQLPSYLPPLIKKISAIGNKIQAIKQSDLIECKKLEDLQLSKNQIAFIEEGAFYNLIQLRVLDLKENKLKYFTQEQLGDNHECLDSIQLSFNQLDVYNCYEGIQNLSVLLLNNNKIKELHKEIINLKNLKTLDISNNDLGDLPSQLGFLAQLVRIQLEGNPLKCIRSNIRSAGALQLKKYLQQRTDDAAKLEVQADPKLKQQLYQSNNIWEEYLRNFLHKDELAIRQKSINLIDNCVFRLTNLIIIDFSQNNIEMIPDQIQQLRNLKKVNFNENKITQISLYLFNLPDLVELELRQNKIQFLPSREQVYLPNLIHLDLGKNLLQNIPNFVPDLTRLRRLLLAYNQIDSIDSLLQKESILEVLDISNNSIDQLNDEIYFKMPNLQHFNLQNNNMRTFPTILGFMSLKTLQIDGNPTKLISRQIIDKGTVHILDYLAKKHPLNQIPPKIQPIIIEEPVINNQSQMSQQQQSLKQRQSNQNSKSSASSQMLVEEPRQQRQYEQQQIIQEQPQQQQQRQQQYVDIGQLRVEFQNLEVKIKQLERELNENFSLNKFQIQEKRKVLQGLMLQRSAILQQINSF
ncbi:unnamed protein product (macronuclear) [Paramecium tetraurelia]|uniref:Uncharacterized protein n=1 Tax=Paramecium tetraurelia TaxID=5888 RepID=A0DBK7_PARTE|nr:uncharacterized protein GSPATT00015320001 [Paramecium tetraurelia]CAK80424.1 unnamed protein product [Paramecium tetraurelia]|eukprot:XP_001447821.1 hypothetical protein (macronuclear) [Paramecium tetraurelia strain d4-2]